MKIREIIEILNAKLLTDEADLDTEIYSACGSDMMSDVLAYVKNQALLLTGLNNPQVVRTASMMDILCVVFVRGKRPDANMIQLAQDLDIIILATDLQMYPACGRLYENGLRNQACKENTDVNE